MLRDKWMGRQTAKDFSRWILIKVTVERKSDRICYTNTMPISTLKFSHPQHTSNSEGLGRPWADRRKRMVSLLGNFLACSTSLTLFSQDLFSWRLKPTSFSMPCLPDWARTLRNYLWPLVSFLCAFLSEAMIRNIFLLSTAAPPWVFFSVAQGGRCPLAVLLPGPLFTPGSFTHICLRVVDRQTTRIMYFSSKISILSGRPENHKSL